MAVWSTAIARATTVGPGFVARIAASNASSHRNTTSSVADGGYWSNASADALPGGFPGFGGSGLAPAPASSCDPNATVTAVTNIRTATRAFDVFFDIQRVLASQLQSRAANSNAASDMAQGTVRQTSLGWS
jgi:hypothetical protein